MVTRVLRCSYRLFRHAFCRHIADPATMQQFQFYGILEQSRMLRPHCIDMVSSLSPRWHTPKLCRHRFSN